MTQLCERPAVLRTMYAINVIVCGAITSICLFFPDDAIDYLFRGTFAGPSDVAIIRMVGSFSASIALVSLFGMFNFKAFRLVFLYQLIFAFVFLLAAVVPYIVNTHDAPLGMISFLVVWMIVLPFVVPWKRMFSVKLPTWRLKSKENKTSILLPPRTI